MTHTRHCGPAGWALCYWSHSGAGWHDRSKRSFPIKDTSMSQLRAALPVLLATRKSCTHVPLVFADCRISIWMHLKYHIPVSSFARDSLHPSFSNSNFSPTAQQLFIAYFSLSRLSLQDTIAEWRKDERSTTLWGANEEERLEAASATSHQIGGIKRRNPFADGRWWKPTGIKGAGEAATRLRADGGQIVLRAQERQSCSKRERQPPWQRPSTRKIQKDSALTQWSLQACGA